MRSPLPLCFALLSITLSFTACKEKSNVGRVQGDIVISGQIISEHPLLITLEELTSEVLPIDTITTDKQGTFKYSLFAEHAGFYRIKLPSGEFITLAAEPKETIHITAQAGDFLKTYQVTGSPGSSILWEINQSIQNGLRQADSLRVVFRDNKYRSDFPLIREELKNQYNILVEDQTSYVSQIIESNPNSLASILALYQFFEDHRLISEDEHFHYFEALSKSLCSNYRSNKHVINLKKWVNDKKRENHQKHQNETNLAIGNRAPDISLPDPNGNNISLSSLQGNLVLIDFWAAWCPPCREANHTLGHIYSTYNQKGFEILGVSLDRAKDHWLRAIEKDNITWQQVSDLRFMNSPVVSLYNVTEVPHYVLVCKKGNIIARNFHISELENLIKENI